MRDTRKELIAHVGGAPSATQRALIERAVQLTLRIATMDRKFAEAGLQTEHDTRTYLAWSASLSRAMRDLGPPVPPTAQRPKSLAEILASHKQAAA